MKNKETILKDWNKNGYVNIPFFTEEEISDIRKEGKRLLVERNPYWEKHGLEGSQPYRLPHTESVIFEKLIRDSSRNGIYNPQKFVNQWSTARQKYNDVLKQLYDPDELRLIDDFVREVRKTFKPRDLVNASNTASALSRIIQQTGRALVGIFGFKFANIQGLLAETGSFDRARDFVGQ